MRTIREYDWDDDEEEIIRLINQPNYIRHDIFTYPIVDGKREVTYVKYHIIMEEPNAVQEKTG